MALVLLVLATARSTLADHYHVPSGSMQPTVGIGDHLLVSKAAYGVRIPFTTVRVVPIGEPRRGDVVVLESPEDGSVLLKRVVGLPGERVAVRDGRVLVDGRLQPVLGGVVGALEVLGGATHPVTFASGGGPDFGPELLPEGAYLVMGDNRGNSRDGRVFGLVRRDAFLGRADRIIWSEGSPTWRSL
jgi:signal peptidase I